MASAVNPITSGSTSTTTAASTSAGMPTEGMFLQLLVSQLKNQDPLNPTDSTQFVSQLAQISELEQVIAIRGDIETQIAATASTATGSTTTTPAGGSEAAASPNHNTGITPTNNPSSS